MIQDKAGHRVPDVTFKVREDYKWVTHSSKELFKDKRVVLFALPGAFTPICSTLHLPVYNDLYETFRANGIDDIYCLAVNDGFVLEAWKRSEKAWNITMLPDVDGEFSSKLGFLLNRKDMCLGNRSWRYAMVINNSVIEKMFIEPEGNEQDPYGESSAEKVLKYLNPSAALPISVTVFTKHGCLICEEMKDLLRSNHLPFEELILNEHFSIKTVKALSGTTSLPQVFLDGRRIERIDELEKLLTTSKS